MRNVKILAIVAVYGAMMWASQAQQATTYTYDAIGRMAKASADAVTVEYTFDKSDNRNRRQVWLGLQAQGRSAVPAPEEAPPPSPPIPTYPRKAR